jgi:hypothetical protein
MLRHQDMASWCQEVRLHCKAIGKKLTAAFMRNKVFSA